MADICIKFIGNINKNTKQNLKFSYNFIKTIAIKLNIYYNNIVIINNIMTNLFTLATN